MNTYLNEAIAIYILVVLIKIMAEITISSLSYNLTIANEFVMNLLLDIDFFRNEILSPLIYGQFSYSLQISRKICYICYICIQSSCDYFTFFYFFVSSLFLCANTYTMKIRTMFLANQIH